MGVRAWFRGLGRRDGRPAPVAAAKEEASRKQVASRDLAGEVAGLSPDEAVERAFDALAGDDGDAGTGAWIAVLRSLALSGELPDARRVQLADFFVGRGDADVAVRALEPMSKRGDTGAAAALLRLADLAQQRGDLAEMARLYEEILAIDLAYPGVRERLARTRRPARAGGAGATLLSPEAARVAEGRIELVRELGRGGAGAVFLARDRIMQREIALKIYHPSRRGDRNGRLRAETYVAAALACRNVVRVYDLHEDLGALSMEFCTGGTLRAVIARGQASVAERRTWIVGVAAALAVVHRRGWVHRDLKPGNVLLRADRVPVLSDFGLARPIGEAVEPFEGTLGYVAPETSSGAADPRMDVFAFGALMRETVGPHDPVLAALMRQCLATDPGTRPADGTGLSVRLQALGLTPV